MDKYAQSKRQTGRGILNELREKMNMPGSYLDKFFKPELERIMAALRVVDDKIRAELTGKNIGDEPPEIPKASKDILKEARKNFARREYMMGAADLGMFHKKMSLIAAEISKWEIDVNRIHHRFLFQGVDEEKLQGLRQHMEAKKAEELNRILKQAGVTDFFYNLLSPRGRALAAWEKKYPKETKALREGGPKLVDAADTLLTNTISLMKEMATARATRRPDDYMDSANKIVAEYNKFDKNFRDYYNNAIMPFMRVKDEIDAKLKAEKPEATPVPAQPPRKMELGYEVPASPGAPAVPGASPATPSVPDLDVPAPKTQQMTLQFEGQPPGASPPFAPAKPPIVSRPPTVPQPPMVPKPEAKPGDITEKTEPPKHAQFYAALESLSHEDPRIVASFISKYAKSIQGTDPETAIRLFNVVKLTRG